SMSVSSRSSTNFFTNGWFMRAVTFQSMARTSSPGWYSRTSSKFIPCPLKTLWYWPPSVSLTSRLVRSSIWRIFLRISRGIMVLPGCSSMERALVSRHRQLIKDLLNDRLAGLLLRLRLVGDRDPVTEDVHADAFDVLGRDITSALEKGVRFGGERQGD